jgi:hypothetical protein
MCTLIGGLFGSCDPAISINFAVLALVVGFFIVRAIKP